MRTTCFVILGVGFSHQFGAGFAQHCRHWHPHEAGGAVGLPDAYMDGVLRHVDRVFNFDRFHKDARAGKLPAFSFFLPPGNQSDHPCNDIRGGEAIVKEVRPVFAACACQMNVSEDL